jgi:ankyrin repeat protein
MCAKQTKTPGLDRQLWAAAAACNGAEVKRLLEAGANPNATYSRESALLVALLAGNSRETRFEGGREVVIEYHPRETVEALLAAGADAGKQNPGGWTPLMAACYSEDLTRLLLPHVKNIDAARKDGATALYLAAINGHADVVRVLLAAGASPNPVNADGESAYDVAFRTPAVRQILAEAGGRPAKELAVGRVGVDKKPDASGDTTGG